MSNRGLYKRGLGAEGAASTRGGECKRGLGAEGNRERMSLSVSSRMYAYLLRACMQGHTQKGSWGATCVLT